MKIRFWKLSGAGNDFVLLSGLPSGTSAADLARRLCDRHFGVGSDGLLVMTRHGKNARLDYRNPDGSSAFCGNGSRCAAVWASKKGWVKGKRFQLETNRGRLEVRLTGKGRAAVSMPTPKAIRLGLKTDALNRIVKSHFIDTGVPHAVVFVPDVNKIDVAALGRALRHHKIFGHAGANVDFVQVRKNVLRIRTYERGVEDETMACGTGVVAAAAISRALGKSGDTVKVSVRSGDTLNVTFGAHTWLEGPTKTTFTGEASL